MGVGWHSAYHRSLAITTSSAITVTRADGRQDIFTFGGGSTWTPQANVTSVLASTTSGYSLTLPDDDSVEFHPKLAVYASPVR